VNLLFVEAEMKRTNMWAMSVMLSIALGCSKEPEQKSPPAKASAPAQPAAAPSAAAGTGTITGKVIYKGGDRAGKLPVGKDREVCGDSKMDPSWIVANDGALRNAVVQIAGLREGATPGRESMVDQVKCEYIPHVTVVPAGATVTFKNSDGILHNIHTVSQVNSPFNRAQPKFLKEIKETFAKPEVVGLRCDVHAWMSGWIIVTDNVYFAVTDADGGFKLTNVPVGKHNLEIWHEKLGTLSQAVEVKAGAIAEVRFEFQSKT
jgi:plastocyanin